MRRLVIALMLAFGFAPNCKAALSFTVEAGGWPDAGRRNAAVAAMQASVNRYNAYGDFGNYNVYAYYNAGIPTAQANYLGSIGYGGTYPNERVTLHEMSHYLGTGTHGTPWDGFRGESLIDQFDGLEASLNGDAAHYWPYGLNFDSEMSEIAAQRHVALLYAMRADMGIGSTANPWSATVVSLTASDALGESSFNYASKLNDGRFAHAGAAYTTGNFTLRTPASGNSFTFAGDSLTVNNTNGITGGLLYKGSGTTGVTTFKNLNLNGGYVRHASAAGDLFRVAGQVTLAQTATVDAAQGPIQVQTGIGGTGSLTKVGGFPLTLTGAGTYAGNTTINAGILRMGAVSPVANYTFDSVSGSTVINNGAGGAAMNGTLAGGATIVGGGRFGNALSVSGGASVDINNPIVDLRHDGNWTVSAWVKTATSGATLLTKNNGSGWSNGNTVFYLGDGTAGGSGGIPSSVRFGGGFNQGSTAATPVNDNTWRQVTYVNSAGTYALYIDGVLQPLSASNNKFTNFDIGTMVRLGATSNPFAGDGTVNFNGLLDSVQFYNQALSGPQIGALYQGSSVTGSLPTTTNVTIASGATLDVNGTTQTVASLSGVVGANVTLGAGRLNVNAATDTQFSGAISGVGGSLVKQGSARLTLAGTTTYSGGTQVDGGTLRVNGSVAGAVTINAGGTLQGGGSVGGLVMAASGATLAPGSSAGALTVGALELAAGSLTEIELGGLMRGSEYDAVLSDSSALLNGTLAVSLINGFSPALGNSFDILDWVTTAGMFESVTLPALASGLAWNVTGLYTSGVLSVVNAVFAPGDFNRDGFVNGADLDIWRPAVGLSAMGDADADGDTDGDDFLVWQRNLGGSPAHGAAAAVPEPTGLWAIGVATVAALSRKRRGS